MKRYTSILLFLFFTLSFTYGQKEIFIKKIEFNLEDISDKDYENEYFMSIKFNKGSTYKFVVTNGINNLEGEAVFELLDVDKLLLTNSIGDKYFKVFSFQCNKTSFYDILISFKDNTTGNSTVDIYLMQ